MMNNNEILKVPEGYKQTEVGVIPDEWEVLRIGDICSEIGDGIHATPIYSDNGECFFINGNNLVSGEVVFGGDTKRTSKEEAYRHRRAIGDQTILLSINGTIGNLAFYENQNVILGKSIAFLNIRNQFNKYFVYHSLSSAYVVDSFFNNLTGSTIKNLGLGVIRNTVLLIPPLKEQTAIANALSDVDALIAELEKLIAKKEAIKTGAMQQLLTGRTRLPQFAKREDGTAKGYKQSELGEIPEDWEVISLFDLADNRKELFDDGDWIEAKYITDKGVKLIQTGNIGIGSYVEKSDKKYISEDSFTQLKCKKLKTRDILICRLAEPAGRACLFLGLSDENVITSVDVTIFRPLNSISREFYVQYFSTPEWFKAISQHVGGTTHKRISRGSLAKILVPLPKEEEQKIIAEIFVDMDSEIEALKKHLDKTKAIKQGMMQELLTGRTRLV